MKLVFLFLLLCSCDFTIPSIPDSGCVVVNKDGNKVHVTACEAGTNAGRDAGAGTGTAGISGSGGASGAGAGSSGSAGVDAGHMHDAGAGSGGAESDIDAGHNTHGGLPVLEPLPAPKPGRTDEYLVSAGGRVPQRDAGGIGAARTRCFVSFESFDDPIVYPGQPGLAHLHQFSGADHVDAFGISATSGGSCRGGAVNLSSYWWPSLLTPQGQVLRPIYMDWYAKASHYDLNGTPQVKLPPKGLKMLAGLMTSTQANPQGTRYLFWSCGEEDGGSRSAGIPNCGTGLLGAHVYFPQCSDGRLDSPDHRAHLSYPRSGACPSTHPILLPSISFHWYYRNVPAGAKLSCDSPTMAGGFCLHADEVFGWSEKIFQSMIDGCINKGLSCGSDLTAEGRSLGIFGGN